TAFAATLLVRQYLRARGVHVRRDMKPVYLGTQDSVILAVARGLVDVGGTWPWSLAAEPASVRSRIQVLGATPPAPQMPIAVSATLMEHDPRTVAALRQALLALPRDVRGRRLLLRLGLPEGFTRARPGDYRAVPVLPRASSR
ncbi:MAG TPA: PhnD/SsuA/transferrin family substrate-binding protein, partial [Acidiferrobacteraceae bacterium]|nr:PhnD/SsuA/transferrin family substrate-binding protein [Acidiferrobacteraceae bacterium]